MTRLFAIVMCLLAWPVTAQDLNAVARVKTDLSRIEVSEEALRIELALTQTVPYRVYFLEAPARLVVDFQEVDWSGTPAVELMDQAMLGAVAYGPFQPGWSRLVVTLSGPQRLLEAGMRVNQSDGSAKLSIQTAPTTLAEFVANAGAPPSARWADPFEPTATDAPPEQSDQPVVVIDPGHGGIDPGATQDGVHEADVMLALGIEVADAINRSGAARAVLTRDADVFVPLQLRITIARQANADLFISLHADALEVDEARGASVYTLSATAQDRASERMAERHERGDIVAGLDLSSQDDRIATVLMEMARRETAPQAERFAKTVIEQLERAGARLNSRPIRDGRLAVLGAADFASVLLEVGFLTSDRDRAMLLDARQRAPLVEGIVSSVQVWLRDEAVRAADVRR